MNVQGLMGDHLKNPHPLAVIRTKENILQQMGSECGAAVVQGCTDYSYYVATS